VREAGAPVTEGGSLATERRGGSDGTGGDGEVDVGARGRVLANSSRPSSNAGRADAERATRRLVDRRVGGRAAAASGSAADSLDTLSPRLPNQSSVSDAREARRDEAGRISGCERGE
jgi:hypothetical protein